jgi:hypothetical protein
MNAKGIQKAQQFIFLVSLLVVVAMVVLYFLRSDLTLKQQALASTVVVGVFVVGQGVVQLAERTIIDQAG